MRVLNVGCGTAKFDFPEASGATEVVGVDINPSSEADIIHDLNRVPWPFDADRFDLVIMQDVIEHLSDVRAMLGEAHRVLRNRGTVRIRTPHYSSSYAYNDPTHIHFFGSFVFDAFDTDNPNCTASASKFAMRKRHVLFPRVWRVTGVAALANRFVHRWEQLFAFVFRAENLYFEMEAVKEDREHHSKQKQS